MYVLFYYFRSNKMTKRELLVWLLALVLGLASLGVLLFYPVIEIGVGIKSNPGVEIKLKGSRQEPPILRDGPPMEQPRCFPRLRHWLQSRRQG